MLWEIIHRNSWLYLSLSDCATGFTGAGMSPPDVPGWLLCCSSASAGGQKLWVSPTLVVGLCWGIGLCFLELFSLEWLPVLKQAVHIHLSLTVLTQMLEEWSCTKDFPVEEKEATYCPKGIELVKKL